jgi:hypothetical protein
MLAEVGFPPAAAPKVFVCGPTPMVEAATGALVGLGRRYRRTPLGRAYDRELKDVLAVQDEVSRTIVAILVAHLNKAEVERTRLKPPAIWQAHDFLMRASDILSAGGRRRSQRRSFMKRRLLERSIALDPSYARGHAALSSTYLTAWVGLVRNLSRSKSGGNRTCFDLAAFGCSSPADAATL